MKRFSRITIDRKFMGGRACIRGLRITVGMIVGLLDEGWRKDEILSLYPKLEDADITEAQRFVAARPKERDWPVGE